MQPTNVIEYVQERILNSPMNAFIKSEERLSAE